MRILLILGFLVTTKAFALSTWPANQLVVHTGRCSQNDLNLGYFNGQVSYNNRADTWRSACLIRPPRDRSHFSESEEFTNEDVSSSDIQRSDWRFAHWGQCTQDDLARGYTNGTKRVCGRPGVPDNCEEHLACFRFWEPSH